MNHPLLVYTILLALTLLTGGPTGCARLTHGLTPPEVTLIDLKPLPGGNLEQRFEITLRVLNPNDIPISSDGVDLELNLNGKRLARALSAENFSIPRLGDDVVVLVATTHLFDIFRQAMALPKTGTLNYEMNGRIFLASSPGSLKFSRKGNLVPDSMTGGFLQAAPTTP